MCNAARHLASPDLELCQAASALAIAAPTAVSEVVPIPGAQTPTLQQCFVQAVSNLISGAI